MGYNSVQFIGKANALKAFENMDCCNWSLLQGKQFIHKYEGTDQSESSGQLAELLKMISESSGSEAVYTLRVYRYDEPKKKAIRGGQEREVKRKIYMETPYDGSFNFKLFDNENEISGKQRAYSEMLSMKSELAEMRELVKEFIKKKNQEDSDQDGEKLSGMAGFFNGLMEVPEIKAAIAGKVIQLFNGVTNKIGDVLTMNNQVPAKIAGPSPSDQNAIQMQPAEVEKLNSALTILVKADPQLPDHLYKLAMIARDNQATYNLLVTQLNSM